ncbi:MAG: AsmA family protein [Woeseiaceae bacterium]|nr:AsmA family protein [Woeseiaceae bacterium]
MNYPTCDPSNAFPSGGICAYDAGMPDIAKTIRNAAAIAAALLVAVVVAGAGTLAWYDGERLSVLATEHLRDSYGIALEVEQLERTFEWRPLITISHLRVSNAAATERTLVDVGAASFRIRPWTLLFDPLTLEDVAINGVTVTVPVDEEGLRYWDPLVTAVSDWFDQFDWSIRRFDLRDLRATSRHLQSENELLVSAREITGTMPRAASLTLIAAGMEVNLVTAIPLRLKGTAKIDRLELAQEGGELPVKLSIDGHVQDRLLSVRMTGGNLLEGDPSEREPVQGSISLGDVVTELQGTMSRDDARHVDVSVTTVVNSKGPAPDLALSFQLSDQDSAWQLSSIRAQQGDSELSGEIEILNRDERRKLNARLNFSQLTFPRQKADRPSPAPGTASVIPEGGLYPQLLEFMREFDAEFDLSAENSVVFQIPFDELHIATSLDHGVLTTTIDESTIEEGQFEAEFQVLPGAASTELSFQATLENASLGAMLAPVENLQDASGTVNGELSVAAAGDKFEEVLGSLAGKLTLAIESGRIPDSIATKLSGNLFAALFASAGSNEMAPIRCAVVEFDIDNGVAKGKRMVIELDDYALYGDGEISLREQRIDIRLVPRAKDFSLVATRVPLRIRGPFDDIELDPVVGEGLISLLTPIELGEPASAGCVGEETPQKKPAQ